MPEEVQDLLEQLAQDNQVSVDEIKQDLQSDQSSVGGSGR